MLYVVEQGSKKILFRVDAWDIDCEKKAIRFLNENGLHYIKDEITLNGDRIVWVK